MRDFPYRTTFWNGNDLPTATPLTNDIDVDVAIVGGGFVGLSSALALQQASPNLRIAVLEAKHVGFGASGRCAGAVVPFAHSIDSMARLFGWEEARWVARYLIEQAGALRDFIRTESIACDYQPGPLIVAATDDRQARRLAQGLSRLTRCGYAIEVLTAAQLRELVYFPAKSGIIFRDDNFAKLQPLALVRGFADAVRKRGTRVYEGSPVERFEVLPDRIDVVVRGGARVAAQKLILATSAYTRRLGWGRFRIFPITVHSYMLATEPLDSSTLEKLGAGLTTSASVIDAKRDFFYLRTYGSQLLIGGGEVVIFSQADEAADRDAKRYRKVLATLHRLFPFLKDTRIVAAWAGPIQTTLTELPIVRSLPGAPNVVLNIAYCNGVPSSYLAGKLIVGLVLGPSYADPDAERLRRIYESTRLSPRELLGLVLEELGL